MTKLRDQVLEFHRAFDVPVQERPAVPSRERLQLRLRLVAEEFCELMWACGVRPVYVDPARILDHVIESDLFREPDMAAIADALADLDYVIEGMRLELGIDGEPVADEVHRANMNKLVDGKVTRRADGKVTKPAGWKPPDVATELRKQGWKER
jgi:predicted HAD superfamily Cof-like phosphohydrolase